MYTRYSFYSILLLEIKEGVAETNKVRMLTSLEPAFSLNASITLRCDTVMGTITNFASRDARTTAAINARLSMITRSDDYRSDHGASVPLVSDRS